ncbi:MAG: hypothetical protein JXC32_04810 [Anaerolineae bacterium]|nr:hypothetical protein [Anaerolineae bacterium]
MVEEPSPFVEEEEPAVIQPGPEIEAAAVQLEVDGHRRSGPILGGLILLVMGVIFLLRNLGVDLPVLRNWWALFILIPVVGSFDRAWRIYQRNGQRMTGEVSGSCIGALALTLVMMAFLFDLRWAIMLPIFLILAGLGALLSAFASGRAP